MYVCPVCDREMERPPQDWNICECCMTEFSGDGDHDITSRTIAEVRRDWKASLEKDQ